MGPDRGRDVAYRLVVFDLDGTLVDSRRDLADSVNALLAELGRPALPERVVTGMVGEGARVLVERALAASGLDRGAVPGALVRFLALYDERLLDHTREYGGITELLSALHGHVTLAVLTNKPELASRRVLKGLGLSRFFEAVIGGDGDHPRKPDAAALLYLMDRFAAAPRETLMIGDSRIDVETARAAGAAACLVSYGFGFEAGLAAGEVMVASSPRELATIVLPSASEASRARGAPPR